MQCRQMIHSRLLSSQHCRCRWWTTIQPQAGVTKSPGQSIWHCSLLKPVLKEQPRAYEYVEAVICVLKIQSQLILQVFMLRTLKSLNNNILSAFYVAPVNPEGAKHFKNSVWLLLLKNSGITAWVACRRLKCRIFSIKEEQIISYE